MPGDFEREIDQSRHSQDMMELHDRMFPMHKAPEQVKHEVAHTVRENQWAGNDTELDCGVKNSNEEKIMKNRETQSRISTSHAIYRAILSKLLIFFWHTHDDDDDCGIFFRV